MGDWVVNYILNQNPDLLLKINKPIVEGSGSGNWHNAAKTLIREFYKAAGRGDNISIYLLSKKIVLILDIFRDVTVSQ
jgi:hypothetical protein